MITKMWRCETPTCPIQTEIVGYTESTTVENLLAVARCLYCLHPLTPVLPAAPASEQPVKN